MTTYDSQTTVTIAGTSYNGKVLRGVTIEMGRDDLKSQPQAGYARIELVDDWGTTYDFAKLASVVISVWNPVTAAQQVVFTGRLAQHDVSVYASGVIDGLARHSLTAVGPLAELNRQVINMDTTIDRAGSIISQALGIAYGTSWDELGSQYTWDSYPASITWDDLAVTGPVGTLDNGGFWLQASATELNALEFIQDIAESSLGVFSENAAGEFDFRDLLYRESVTPIVIDAGDILTPDLSTTSRVSDLINIVTSTYLQNGIETSLRAESSILEFGNQTAQRDHYLSYALYDIYPYYSVSTDIEQSDYQNTLILNARASSYTYPNQLTVQLENPNMTNAMREDFIGIANGAYLQVSELPAAFLPDNGMNNDGVFHCFVEGWTWRLTDKQAELVLRVSDYRESFFAI